MSELACCCPGATFCSVATAEKRQFSQNTQKHRSKEAFFSVSNCWEGLLNNCLVDIIGIWNALGENSFMNKSIILLLESFLEDASSFQMFANKVCNEKRMHVILENLSDTKLNGTVMVDFSNSFNIK